ncbi:unnamed protein product [Bursaphelenchus xylophilus]|uniref:(pine wood nematode) hypothetical protein n=1 Tax=Bursaphelenchus xylophilus TaxID=6326 RepID=A0A1I7S8Q5_BURXY|nr:unnamed protein product [Bursaphelenchus xylophilus]CAG9089328.1 unnamed protein product [Bursaphelenchus xylophilus]
MFEVVLWRTVVVVALLEVASCQYFFDKSREVHPKKHDKYEKPNKSQLHSSELPNSSSSTSTITMDNRTFIQDFAAGTYYIRKAESGDEEAKRPRSLFPERYSGPAEFYAFYSPRFARTFYVNYVSGERGSVRGYHVFDDTLERFQPVSMVQKMMEMMRDTPFFN